MTLSTKDVPSKTECIRSSARRRRTRSTSSDSAAHRRSRSRSPSGSSSATTPTSRGCSRSCCGSHATGWAPGSRSRTTRSFKCSCSPSMPSARASTSRPRSCAPTRGSVASSQARALRPSRIDARRRLRHVQARHAHQSQALPRLRRGRRLRTGSTRWPSDSRRWTKSRLCKERPSRVRDPIHAPGTPARVPSRLHRADRRRPRRRRPAQPDRRGLRPSARRQAGEVRRPRELSGYRPSTTSASSAAGSSSRSATHGPCNRRSATSSTRRAWSPCRHDSAQGTEKQEGRRRRLRRSATRTSGRTSRPTSSAVRRGRGEAPEADLYPRDRVARPAARLEGKDEQDAGTSRCRRCRSTSRRRSSPAALIENLRQTPPTDEPEPELSLFDDFNGIEFEELVDFYRHEQNWSNRLILGDSLLVMTSLAEKEGLRGKVQTIYHRPAIRDQVRVQLAGLHAEARCPGRQARGRHAASPSRSGRSATHGSTGSTPISPTCAIDWPWPASCSRRPASSSCRSATRTSTSCDPCWTRSLARKTSSADHVRQDRGRNGRLPAGNARLHRLVREGARAGEVPAALFEHKDTWWPGRG